MCPRSPISFCVGPCECVLSVLRVCVCVCVVRGKRRCVMCTPGRITLQLLKHSQWYCRKVSIDQILITKTKKSDDPPRPRLGPGAIETLALERVASGREFGATRFLSDGTVLTVFLFTACSHSHIIRWERAVWIIMRLLPPSVPRALARQPAAGSHGAF